MFRRKPCGFNFHQQKRAARYRLVSRIVMVLLLAGFLDALPRAAAAQSPVGSIKTYQDKAAVVREGARIPAQTGLKVYIGDMLQTDQNGSLGIIFHDDTLVSIGPDSQLSIDTFLFQPDQGRFAFLSRLIQGTAVFVSGRIAKFAPEAMQVQTPRATIGVRGTRFAVLAEGTK
jgi:hypothetical protein